MKKIIALLMTLVLMVSFFTGCSSTSAPVNGTGNQSDETSKVEASKLIVYTQKTLDQYFHVALQDSLEKAVKAAGFTAEIANCNNDSTLQNNQILNFVAKKPKGMIVNAVDSDAINDSVTEAKNAGIPVIQVDNPSSTAVSDAIVTFDNYGAGYTAAKLIVDKLIKKYGSAKGRVVNVYGAMSSECWRLRKDGFDACMKENPGIEYLQVPGEGEQAKSQEALTNIIAQYNGKIDAVHCPSDAPGLGCAEALKIADLWYPTSDPKHIIFVTADGEPDAVVGLKNGYYDGIVVEDAYAYGQIATDLFTQYIFKGKPVPTSGYYENNKFYWKKAEFENSERGPILKVPPYVLDTNNINEDGHWGVMALKAQGK
ncbi:MAG: sugar ABC transporter substrate-binding protein [Ruminiclostridium sp.]